MVCDIPKNKICYFVGPCDYKSKSMAKSSAHLVGLNVCWTLHANYKPGREEMGGEIPFTITGDIMPQQLQPDIYPPVTRFKVTGTRIRDAKFFNASGQIGDYTVKPFKILFNAKPSSNIVDIEVRLPSEALLAQRNAR